MKLEERKKLEMPRLVTLRVPRFGLADAGVGEEREVEEEGAIVALFKTYKIG